MLGKLSTLGKKLTSQLGIEIVVCPKEWFGDFTPTNYVAVVLEPAQLIATHPGVFAVYKELLKPTLNGTLALKSQILPGPDPTLLQDHAETSPCFSKKDKKIKRKKLDDTSRGN